MNLPRSYGVIVSDVLPDTPALAAGIRVGDVLLTIDGRMAESIPYVSFRLMSVNAGEKVHLEVLRGQERLAFDCTRDRKHSDNMDQISSPGRIRKKIWFDRWAFWGSKSTKKVAAMAPDLRDPFWHYRGCAFPATRGLEIPLTTGDVIRTLNGQPMTTLDRLRSALAELKPGAPVVLQIQRDDRLLYISFTLEQPL